MSLKKRGHKTMLLSQRNVKKSFSRSSSIPTR